MITVKSREIFIKCCPGLARTSYQCVIHNTSKMQEAFSFILSTSITVLPDILYIFDWRMKKTVLCSPNELFSWDTSEQERAPVTGHKIWLCLWWKHFPYSCVCVAIICCGRCSGSKCRIHSIDIISSLLKINFGNNSHSGMSSPRCHCL